MPRDYDNAILDYVLAKAFTEGTINTIMREIWDHAYHLGFMDGTDLIRERYVEEDTHAGV